MDPASFHLPLTSISTGDTAMGADNSNYSLPVVFANEEEFQEDSTVTTSDAGGGGTALLESLACHNASQAPDKVHH